MKTLNILDHPLLQHKISLMRDKNLGTKEFRELASEVATLMTYEVTRDLPLKTVQIETPVAIATTKVISGRKVAFVPILRAGLGMVDGAISLVPAAKVGHVGICHENRVSDGESVYSGSSVKYHGDGMLEYYCKLPFDICEREVIVMDLMLATGRSAVHAVSEIKAAGCVSVKFMAVVACPEGVAKLHSVHPDVDIYCGALDDSLNEDGYITPGFGDGGDRIFGTK